MGRKNEIGNQTGADKKEYRNFTPALAAFDAVPVLLFGGTVIIVGTLLKSPLFLVGAVISFLAGFAKVIWKFLVALKSRDISLLSKQMRILMPAGFLLMIVGFFCRPKDPAISELFRGALHMPVLPFLIIGLLGFVLMGVFAAKLDSTKAKNNWIEQTTNAIGQLALFIAALLLRF